MHNVRVKRIYDAAEPEDGKRVLIDRLWPRGLKKERAKLDAWMREIAPSPDLRKWFAHDRKKYEAFCRRYLDELRTQPECAKAVCRLRKWVETEPVTLLYAARDTACNHARVVRHLLLDDVETLLEEARIRSLHENRE